MVARVRVDEFLHGIQHVEGHVTDVERVELGDHRGAGHHHVGVANGLHLQRQEWDCTLAYIVMHLLPCLVMETHLNHIAVTLV